MGTSTAYGGPGGGTPLIPSWLDNAPRHPRKAMAQDKTTSSQ